MTPTRGPDWKRLGRYVRARREQLGLLQDEFSVQSGVSRFTLYKLETAQQTGYRRETFRDLEAGLGWATGSVDAILEGGEPSERVEESDDRLDRLLAGMERITDNERRFETKLDDLTSRVELLEGGHGASGRPRRR
jgi:transcriptional regulator with XRE-family HTH domain